MRFFLFIIFTITLIFTWGYWYYTDLFAKKVAGRNDDIVYYDTNDQPFYIFDQDKSRNFVSLDQINVNLLKAVLSLEDKRFFQHIGFDVPRLAKAVYSWIQVGRPTFGASTITQQLCKITLFSNERSLKRKLQEFLCAIFVEIKYSKKEILEFYINAIYFGRGNVGIVSAAENFFNKSPAQLNLAESAILAGLIKKPEAYLPKSDVQITRNRQLIALKQLYKLGWITQLEYNEAINKPVYFRKNKKENLIAPYFVSAVTSQLKKDFGYEIFSSKGFKVRTTLDLKLQRSLEKVISDWAKNQTEDIEISAVTLDNKGHIKALVGGRDFNISQFNRAVQAIRQPGSAIKPFIYAYALENGWQAFDTIIDEPVSFSNQVLDIIDPNDATLDLFNDFFAANEGYYEPSNFDNQHHGEMTLAYALQTSNNVVAVRLLDLLGVSNFIDFSQFLNLGFRKEQGLCIALGCSETSLLQLTSAMSVFSNGGIYCQPQLYIEVETDQQSLFSNYNQYCSSFISETTAYIMEQLLHNVVEYGTAKNAKMAGYIGGKTGTSSDNRDAWFIGFNGYLITGIWLGKDDNSSLNNETGGRTPALLWKKFMDLVDVESKAPDLVSGWQNFFFNSFTGCLTDDLDPNRIELLLPVSQLNDFSCFN